jgi:hypothetical protein
VTPQAVHCRGVCDTAQVVEAAAEEAHHPRSATEGRLNSRCQVQGTLSTQLDSKPARSAASTAWIAGGRNHQCASRSLAQKLGNNQGL